MSEDVEQAFEAPEEGDLALRRRRRRRMLAGVATALVVVLAGTWLARERIARKIIADELASYDLPARYTLDKVGVGHHVLTGVAIGDPAHPDLTVERVEVDIVPTFGLPTIGKVVLVRPRLHGTFHDGKASFGALDKVIYAERPGPAGLPDLDLTVIDGRGRIDSDYGPVGVALDGEGNLRDGFAGTLAGYAPGLKGSGCRAGRTTLLGKLASKDARMGFSGPLRTQAVSCPGQGLSARSAELALDLTANQRFDGLDGRYALTSADLGWGAARLARIEGKGEVSLDGSELTLRYGFEGQRLAAGWAEAERIGFEGQLRGHDGLTRIESQGSVSGSALRPGPMLTSALGAAEADGEGTLFAPLAAQLRVGLEREGRASRLSASYTLRRSGEATTLVVPEGSLRGTSRTELLRLDRMALSLGAQGAPRLSGQAHTGGPGLPALALNIEAGADGTSTAQFALKEYRAGDAAVDAGSLTATLRPDGTMALAGDATISGAVPGGTVEQVTLPIEGTWSERRGLALGTRCTTLGFARLGLGSFAFERQGVKLCPERGAPMLASDARGLRFALSSPGLALSGTSGGDPVRIESGRLALSGRGELSARDLSLTLGRGEAASSFRLGEVTGGGRFSDGEMRLGPVPLDLSKASGAWRYANGALLVEDGAFTVKDRELAARFEPLVAHGASLRFKDGQIVAEAVLREPTSDREVVRTTVTHDLASGRGHADLAVPALVFDEKLQPDMLIASARGVIALAQGTLSGGGRIDWTASKVTSTGRFHTDGIDFAAAFGPTKGVSGTVEFTDLVGLVSAPDQRLRIAAINPGIEVGDGEVSFQLEPDRVLTVNGAHWPFIDGTLDLLPTRMVLGAAEVRRYTLKVDGVNAAKFVAQLELGNIAATGVFDGELPLVFDENGGRIENGLLISRPPGGNVSYVGNLTYEDMGTMANFAFQSLRSLDYRRMEIGLEGALEGEIVSRLKIDGVRQGEGAKKSIVSRSLADLPIQFNIQIRAPFQRLLGSFRRMYDPTYLPDPRKLGLIGKDGRPVPPPPAKPVPSAPRDSAFAVQPPDSRNKP